jgi:hypothetical protein
MMAEISDGDAYTTEGRTPPAARWKSRVAAADGAEDGDQSRRMPIQRGPDDPQDARLPEEHQSGAAVGHAEGFEDADLPRLLHG